MSKKLSSRLISQIETTCIHFQVDIAKRLKLYIFCKSAIDYFCTQKLNNFEDYEFEEFKNKFKLSQFKDNKNINIVESKKLKKYGETFIENELGNSIFVLNMSAFENWYLTLLQFNFRNNLNALNKRNGDEVKKIDLSWILESKNMDDLWDKIIEDHIRKIPYMGLEAALKKFIKQFDLETINFKNDIIGIINEKHLLRNCIIHNRNIVDKKYVKESKQFCQYKIGDTINISEKLLFNQVDALWYFIQEFRNNIKAV